MDKSTPDEDKKGHNLFIDVDLVRGSVFSKTKPRHRWVQVFFWGVLRTAFAPLYWDYWREHTSSRMAAYIMFHFFVQFLQAICFLLIDPEKSKSLEHEQQFTHILGRETDPPPGRSPNVVRGGRDRVHATEMAISSSNEHKDGSPNRMVVRHRRTNLPHASMEPEGLSSDADEEEAEDEFENVNTGFLLPGSMESAPAERHPTSWSRGTTRIRGIITNRPKPAPLRLKTASCLPDSGHTTGEDEADLLVPAPELAEIQVEPEPNDHSPCLDEALSSADARSNLFSRDPWGSPNATSLFSPTRGHEADGEESETELHNDHHTRPAVVVLKSEKPNLQSPQNADQTEPCCLISDQFAKQKKTNSASVDRVSSNPLKVQRLSGSNLNVDHMDSVLVPSTEPVNVEAISLETIIPSNEPLFAPKSPGKSTLTWTTDSVQTDHLSDAAEIALESPASISTSTVFADPNRLFRRPRIRSWSIGLPVDQRHHRLQNPACVTNSSIVPFCYGSSLGLSHTMLSIISDDQQHCCFWGIGSLSRMVNAARRLSSPTVKPIPLGWDSIGRDFSSMQALRAPTMQCGVPVTNQVGGTHASHRHHHHHHLGRASVSDLSSAQSTSSTGSQLLKANDRSGLHRDLESVHGVGAELCANPKSSWNGTPEDLGPSKSSFLSSNPKAELGKMNVSVETSFTHTNHNGVLMDTGPRFKYDSKNTSFEASGPTVIDEQDEDDRSPVDSQHEMLENTDSFSLNRGANEDTFTTRSRQRANFLQLFLRRAHNYRQQSRTSTEALDKSGSRVHRSNQLSGSVAHTGAPATRFADTFSRKEELTRLDPSLRRRIPSGLRQSSMTASQSISSGFHNKSQGNPIGASMGGSMYNWTTTYNNVIDRKASFSTRGKKIKVIQIIAKVQCMCSIMVYTFAQGHPPSSSSLALALPS
ncbi:unnamed protein product [Echinostoma caproni]|uniref:Phtf-FEM1B_bdg domain-containing protein n=1 Tax=Echinostoma caproni TaxID=27848 RepID=A0A183ADW7_9TREM|nr:unnamed protein product [Echinostoma caproni]